MLKRYHRLKRKVEGRLGGASQSALWMLLRGMTTALGTVVLGFVLSRTLRKNAFDNWTLLLGVASWLQLLDLGLTSAVHRFVGGTNDPIRHGQIVANGKKLLRGPTWAAAFAVILLSHKVTTVFPSTTHEPRAGAALLALCLPAIIGVRLLPASAYFLAVFRVKTIAYINLVVRVVQLGAVFFAASGGSELTAIGLAYSLPPLAGSILVWALFRREVPKTDLAGRTSADATFGYSARIRTHVRGTLVWSGAGVFVASVDTSIVGRVDQASTGTYGLALGIALFVGGLHGAILSPMIARIASLAESPRDAGVWLLMAARKSNLIMTAMTVSVVILSIPLSAVLPDQFSKRLFVQILLVLELAFFLRLLGAPYASAVVGTGEHNKVVLSPLLEALTNVLASIFLGLEFGAIGVAAGSLVGSVVSIGMHLFHNIPRTKSLAITTKEYVGTKILPLSCSVALAGSVVGVLSFRLLT
jgi:O-antigen/teichoic acid export membrane protein